jgi:hypothetical protein
MKHMELNTSDSRNWIIFPLFAVILNVRIIGIVSVKTLEKPE